MVLAFDALDMEAAELGKLPWVLRLLCQSRICLRWPARINIIRDLGHGVRNYVVLLAIGSVDVLENDWVLRVLRDGGVGHHRPRVPALSSGLQLEWPLVLY